MNISIRVELLTGEEVNFSHEYKLIVTDAIDNIINYCRAKLLIGGNVINFVSDKISSLKELLGGIMLFSEEIDGYINLIPSVRDIKNILSVGSYELTVTEESCNAVITYGEGKELSIGSICLTNNTPQITESVIQIPYTGYNLSGINYEDSVASYGETKFSQAHKSFISDNKVYMLRDSRLYSRGISNHVYDNTLSFFREIKLQVEDEIDLGYVDLPAEYSWAYSTGEELVIITDISGYYLTINIIRKDKSVEEVIYDFSKCGIAPRITIGVDSGNIIYDRGDLIYITSGTVVRMHRDGSYEQKINIKSTNTPMLGMVLLGRVVAYYYVRNYTGNYFSGIIDLDSLEILQFDIKPYATILSDITANKGGGKLISGNNIIKKPYVLFGLMNKNVYAAALIRSYIAAYVNIPEKITKSPTQTMKLYVNIKKGG